MRNYYSDIADPRESGGLLDLLLSYRAQQGRDKAMTAARRGAGLLEAQAMQDSARQGSVGAPGGLLSDPGMPPALQATPDADPFGAGIAQAYNKYAPDAEFYKDVGSRIRGGLESPEFWGDAAKELAIGVPTALTNLGVTIGGVAPALYHNWQEGLPLDTNMPRFEDTVGTAEWYANKMGMPFSNTARGDAGRFLAGLAAVPRAASSWQIADDVGDVRFEFAPHLAPRRLSGQPSSNLLTGSPTSQRGSIDFSSPKTGVTDGTTSVNRPSASASATPERGLIHDEGAMVRSAQDIRAPATEVLPATRLANLPATARIGERTVPVGPSERTHATAQQYMRRAGLDYTPMRTYRAVDPERAGRIAIAFTEMRHAPKDPAVQSAYADMIDETLEQYEIIKESGLKVEFITGDVDPYGNNPRMGMEDIKNNNHLFVFSTRDGYGQTGITAADLADNPLLAETNVIISGQRALANDVFRLVHDWFGHNMHGVGFRATGEENAWRSHSRMYTPNARRAMTNETRGQNSWVNFGPHKDTNPTAKGAETIYAPQKIGLMPKWVTTEGVDDLPEDLAELTGGASRTAIANELVSAMPATQDPRPARYSASLKNPPVFPDQPQSSVIQNIAHGVAPGQIISTRYPVGANLGASEAELLHSGVESILQNPAQAESMANIFKAMPGSGSRIPDSASPEQAIRMQMDFEAENLTDLYNSMDPIVRERSKMWYMGANKMANRRSEQYNVRVENAAGVYAALSPGKDWYQNVELGDRMMDIMSTKADAPWSRAMTNKYEELTAVNPKTGKRMNAGMIGRIDNIRGRTLAELSEPEDKADWIRIYDEAHNEKGLVYPSFTPEGQPLGLVRRLDGEPKTLVHQSNDNRARAVRAFEARGDIGEIMQIISPEMGAAHKVRNFYNNIVDPLNPGGFITIDTHQVAAGLLRPLGGSAAAVKQNFGRGLPLSDPRYGPATRAPAGSDPTGVTGTYGVHQGATQQAAEQSGILGAQMQSPVWEQIRAVFPPEMKRDPKLMADVERIWNEYGNRLISRHEAFEHIMNLRPIDVPDWAKIRAAVAAAILGGGGGLLNDVSPEAA